MEAKFSFFKAGQGSFYGGRIWHQKINKTFTIIYDCGTSPFISGNSQSLNSEINAFKNSPRYFPNSDKIDLLFISHLDYDHVSGLKRILAEFSVKNIILPYIEKQQRQFFLLSFSPENSPNGNDLTISDYSDFIESPHTFIQNNSENRDVQIFFVKPDDKIGIEYEGYDIENQSEDVYPRGTQNFETEEFAVQSNIFVYNNNLQFFIQQKWEFTTYVKSTSDIAITKLHNCLKKKFKKKAKEILAFEDLKEIITNKRKEAHKCYTDYIGEINSHGLVLLHGPIRFENLCGNIYSDCELNHFYDDCRYHHYFHHKHHFRNNNPIMLGTLLFGDTSINNSNNQIDFPTLFKDKLVNVHIVQVPHHGSSKNWNFDRFKELKIGDSINRWNNKIISVCNFGYGNKYGHPSHEVLNDLRSTIFLNTQFSRLNIKYDIIHWIP